MTRIGSRKGIELVELMIIFAIIGILAAIIIPNVMVDRPRTNNINHGMSVDPGTYPSAQDALTSMTNAGFLSPKITKIWAGEMKTSACAKVDRTAYSIVAQDDTEMEHSYLVCCRGTGRNKACIILRNR